MLARNSAVTMYEQLVDVLKEEIFQKKVANDGCLGTHKDLAEKYNVSLITIRKALQILQEQGIVEVKQGKGTFVSRNILANKHNFFSGFVDVLSGETNSESNTRLLRVGIVETPVDMPSHILLLLGQHCHLNEKVYFLRGRPAGHYVSYIPLHFGAQFTAEDFRLKTAYELYTERLGIQLGKGFQRIRAISANPEQAALLNISTGAPLIFIQRETYNKTGEFLEIINIYCEYSQYEYTVSLDG